MSGMVFHARKPWIDLPLPKQNTTSAMNPNRICHAYKKGWALSYGFESRIRGVGALAAGLVALRVSKCQHHPKGKPDSTEDY